MDKRGMGVLGVIIIVVAVVIGIGFLSGNVDVVKFSPAGVDVSARDPPTTHLEGGGRPECNDGRDNDGDGLKDYPRDPDCSSKSDKTENFYEICTARDLDRVREDLSGEYVQKCNVDLSDWGEFEPIGGGFDRIAFFGLYDGNGYSIKNVFVNKPEEDRIGFFSISDGVFRNIFLNNISVIGNNSVGGLIGEARDSNVSNSHVAGIVRGNSKVGGLIGDAFGKLFVLNSSTSGAVMGADERVGGFIGIIVSDGILQNSFSTSNIWGENQVGGLVGNIIGGNINNSYSTGQVTGNRVVGGLVGSGSLCFVLNSHSTGKVNAQGFVGGVIGDSTCLFENSYSTGEISGDINVGGFAGRLLGPNPVSNSYSASNVTGRLRVGGFAGLINNLALNDVYSTGTVNGGEEVGGLLGSVLVPNRILNIYSSGLVSGSTNVGGLIGFTDFIEVLDIDNSYWDIETSGQTESAGGEGRTTENMTSVPRPDNTYVNWSFADEGGGIWVQVDGEYPFLSWEV